MLVVSLNKAYAFMGHKICQSQKMVILPTYVAAELVIVAIWKLVWCWDNTCIWWYFKHTVVYLMVSSEMLVEMLMVSSQMCSHASTTVGNFGMLQLDWKIGQKTDFFTGTFFVKTSLSQISQVILWSKCQHFNSCWQFIIHNYSLLRLLST